MITMNVEDEAQRRLVSLLRNRGSRCVRSWARARRAWVLIATNNSFIKRPKQNRRTDSFINFQIEFAVASAHAWIINHLPKYIAPNKPYSWCSYKCEKWEKWFRKVRTRDRSDDTKQFENVCKLVAFQRICSTASLFRYCEKEVINGQAKNGGEKKNVDGN